MRYKRRIFDFQRNFVFKNIEFYIKKCLDWRFTSMQYEVSLNFIILLLIIEGRNNSKTALKENIH